MAPRDQWGLGAQEGDQVCLDFEMARGPVTSQPLFGGPIAGGPLWPTQAVSESVGYFSPPFHTEKILSIPKRG